ncbi:MAG: HD domain-containing protein [Spirochaetes bacterium]|nr:HD domain-containing protein [Spirochaetota bacterium]
MDCTDLGEPESAILGILERTSKPSRRFHSLSVAVTVESLCLRFGIDPRKGRVAGLGHDIVKDRPIEEQWALAGRTAAHSQTMSFFDLVSSLEDTEFADKVVHGPAGAVFLFESGLVGSEDVLRAVAYHSTARLGMGSLEKIVFAADKLEPGRKGAGPEEAKALIELGLDDLFFFALKRSMRWLGFHGASIAQSTIDLYNALKSAGKGT